MTDADGELGQPAVEPAQSRASGPGGQCAVHEDELAVGTCTRCGNFLCVECTENGRFELCPPCRERVGVGTFPFARDRWSVGDVLSYSWAVFQQQWMMLVAGTVILYFVSFLVSILSNVVQLATADQPALSLSLSLAISVVQNVINGIITLGLTAMAIDAMVGRKVELGQIARQARKIGKLLVQYLVLFVVLGIPMGALLGIPLVLMLEGNEDLGLTMLLVVSVLLIGPFIFVAIGLYFIQLELVYDDDVGAIEAMKNSWALVRGFRFEVFLIMLVTLAIMAIGFMMCCVGIVAAHPLALLVTAGTYLALRNGSGLREPTSRMR